MRWYLRSALSFRDVEELFRERGLEAGHTTIWRWVQRYGPELEERRLRRHLKPTTRSWRVDEIYVRVKGRSWAGVWIPDGRTQKCVARQGDEIGGGFRAWTLAGVCPVVEGRAV